MTSRAAHRAGPQVGRGPATATAPRSGEDAAGPLDRPGVTDPAGTAWVRLVLGVVSLVALVLGLLGLVTGVETLRWLGALVFCLVGVGSAPWQLDASMGTAERLTSTGVTAFGVLTLPSVVMVQLGVWYPAVAFVVVAVPVVLLHLIGLRRALAALPPRGSRWEAAPPEPVHRHAPPIPPTARQQRHGMYLRPPPVQISLRPGTSSPVCRWLSSCRCRSHRQPAE